MSHSLKILVLTTSYPSDQNDPSGIFIAKLLEALARRNHDITVLAPSNGLFYGSKILAGIKVHRFGYFHPRSLEKLTNTAGGIPETVSKSLLAKIQIPLMMSVFLIESLFLSSKADCIYANWIGAGVIGAITKLFRGKPLVVSFRGDDGYMARDKPFWRWITKWVIKNSEYIAPVSKELNNIMLELGADPHKCTLPRFGVDLDFFHPQEKSEVADEVKIIFVGAILRKKGVQDLFQAFLGLPKSRLIMVGDGTDIQELRSLNRKLGIAHRTEWKGMLSPSEVAEQIRSADVLCLPSYTEGRPNVVNEAMASGIPVVATAVGGIPDMVVEGQTAFLYTPGDVKTLQALLKRLVDDRALRTKMGRNSRVFVQQRNLTWDTTALDFEELFLKALNVTVKK
jgi:glycosyltransferase involved in cell wall biosynthesis